MWDHSTCYCECNKACKIDECLGTNNCSCKKRLFGKLVLEYEDEILNTTETSPDDKKKKHEKSNFLIHNILLTLYFCYY